MKKEGQILHKLFIEGADKSDFKKNFIIEIDIYENIMIFHSTFLVIKRNRNQIF